MCIDIPQSKSNWASLSFDSQVLQIEIQDETRKLSRPNDFSTSLGQFQIVGKFIEKVNKSGSQEDFGCQYAYQAPLQNLEEKLDFFDAQIGQLIKDLSDKPTQKAGKPPRLSTLTSEYATQIDLSVLHSDDTSIQTQSARGGTRSGPQTFLFEDTSSAYQPRTSMGHKPPSTPKVPRLNFGKNPEHNHMMSSEATYSL